MSNLRKRLFIFSAILLLNLVIIVYIIRQGATSTRGFLQTARKQIQSMWGRNTSKTDEEDVTSAVFQSQFVVVDSVSSIPTNSRANYVLVIPRRIKKSSGTMILERNDQQAASIAGRMMDAMNNLDGLACLPRKLKNKTGNLHRHLSNEEWKGIFNTTWCNFARREWSIQIRNSGNMKKFKFGDHNAYATFQMCNLINGPFVLRKEKFVQLNGLRPDFGRLSLLDFFLRSNGTLTIGKFGNCFYNDELFYIDRGSRKADEFPEYSDFGVKHGVLRIIMEDRIEWTKCVATNRHCKEEPYIAPTTLPQIGQPICCSIVLGEMLKDLVNVFTKLGIDYRVVYGTLLGGERSGAIIPYSYDIDISLEEKFSRDVSNFDGLQKYFTDKYYISGSLEGMPRMIPTIPVHLNIKTSSFFNGELDLQGDNFFSSEIVNTIEGLLPFNKTKWRARGYTDFYPARQSWWKGTSNTTFIDGVECRTVNDKIAELELKYGKDWKTPILTKYEGQSDEKSGD